jgi:D-glycero-D-manno-heptose 1,7-bisphosphate phosphatase
MKLVLLDRDGVLNDEIGEYITDPGKLRMIPGSAAAVARLNRAGFKVAICTNQGVVGRGIIDDQMLGRINERLAEYLAREGARWDALFVCTDHPDKPTRRRKPGPGMLEEALRQFRATAAETPMIGDNLRDLEAAMALGCPRHLVRTGHGTKAQADGIPASVLPVRVHDDLAAAVTALLGSET